MGKSYKQNDEYARKKFKDFGKKKNKKHNPKNKSGYEENETINKYQYE